MRDKAAFAASRDDEERVVWPADFATRFAVFVDVEEEFDWAAPLSSLARATTAIPALADFAEHFARAGVGVTYLADHPVTVDPRAADVLRHIAALPEAEIGTQLHPWVNPPHLEPIGPATSFAGNLPASLEAAKLDALTDAIERAVGRRPRAYRAGRYGFGPRTAGLLASRGYRLDTSMRAGFDYRTQGGPDFRRVSNHAFWLESRTLLELPLTTMFTGRLGRFGRRLHGGLGMAPRLQGLLSRTRLVSRIPLSPEGTSLAEALEAIRVAVDVGLPVINLSFHSPSLVAGHTPYVRDATDLVVFHRWWDGVLALFDRLGIRAASLDQLLHAACQPASEPANRDNVGL